MEDLIFSKLQKGDTIYTLERDRRSGYPIFDTAKVLKVGESKPRATLLAQMEALQQIQKSLFKTLYLR